MPSSITYQYDLLSLLDYIEPANCSYNDWLSVGMALKESGYTAADWDNWSKRDMSRYHQGECFRKWSSFLGSQTPVTGGTIVQMARENGWRPESQWHELDWESVIGEKDELKIIDKGWIEGKDITEPAEWRPAQELIKYLETLFESSENVGYVTESWEKDGRYMPTKGNWDRTAGELIQQLNQCGGDIGAVLGDYKEDAGAWIRFNPLDGAGCRNDNVTDFRYALVESDSMELEQQNAIIRELELPVACLVFSGGKSIHAIVRIEAANAQEYRKRVDYLYDVLKKNGLQVDTQNKNPSRLSRMPGVMRKGKKQFLIDTNIGKASWAEWQEWIEGINDNLPEPESLSAFINDLPELSPPLIENILRQGHKMLLAGPSKAGKSYALIELCCAIAGGHKWLGFKCTQGKVLYVNLELDRASCLHRFRDIYDAMGWNYIDARNIDIWNLRGNSVPMDKLAPKLIRRAAKKNYIAIVIDPIYKIITGDENSADQMAAFCNQFDKVANELNAAVIYCHHHSKGGQGQKRSMDRASGSGVFARDPDALIDLIELDVPQSVFAQERNNAVCMLCRQYLKNALGEEYDEKVYPDDECNSNEMMDIARRWLRKSDFAELSQRLAELRSSIGKRSAWRIEGTLREFPKFKPVNLWFDYPRHVVDRSGVLDDLDADAGMTSKGSPYKKNFGNKKTKEQRLTERRVALETAFEACAEHGRATVKDLSENMGKSEDSVRNYVKEHETFAISDGIIFKK